MAQNGTPTSISQPQPDGGGLPPVVRPPVTQQQSSGDPFSDPANLVGATVQAGSPGKDRGRGAVERSIGSAKATLGKLVNSDTLVEKGALQHDAGLQQEQKGRVTDSGEGLAESFDRGVRGVIDKITPDNLDEGVVPVGDKKDELF